MKTPIHVLHVLGGVGLGGAESRIMDLYRQMDREQIQFDFLVHQSDTSVRKPQFYDEEIQSMGGHIYVLPKFKVYKPSATNCRVSYNDSVIPVPCHMVLLSGILPVFVRLRISLTPED